jgi:hypothetical protein
LKAPKIRYFLESKSNILDERTEKELIMAEINYGYKIIKNGVGRYKPFRFSLEQNILPSKFGTKERNYKFDRVIFEKYQKNNATVKTMMIKLEDAINELHNQYLISGIIPTPEVFKNELKMKLGRTDRVVIEEISILEYLYLKIAKDTVDSESSKKSKKRINTIKTYRTLSHMLENYQIASGEILHFKSFSEKQYWKLWDVLDKILKDEIKVYNPNQPRKQSKQYYGYLVNSMRKYQTTLMRALKDAKKDGYLTEVNVFDDELILEKKEGVKDFYIEEKILKLIIGSNVEFDAILQHAKDYFIIGCLTGMRYESMFDTKNTKIETYHDEKYSFQYIVSVQNKTSTKVIIPLLEPVRVILDKYGHFPEFKANSTINSDLKKLFKYLKLSRLEEVTLVTYSCGEIKLNEPLDKLISTHDCKKSFYSNLFELGVKESVIDNITHPDKATINKMAPTYNKTKMLTKAKLFVDEVNNKKSKIYRF